MHKNIKFSCWLTFYQVFSGNKTYFLPKILNEFFFRHCFKVVNFFFGLFDSILKTKICQLLYFLYSLNQVFSHQFFWIFSYHWHPVKRSFISSIKILYKLDKNVILHKSSFLTYFSFNLVLTIWAICFLHVLNYQIFWRKLKKKFYKLINFSDFQYHDILVLCYFKKFALHMRECIVWKIEKWLAFVSIYEKHETIV